jgi:uncharacterized membrane protein HdeD (DUF308 family)
MLTTMTHYWWLMVLRGALAILFGIAAILWPGIAFATLVLLFGAFAFASGVITTWTALSLRKRNENWMAFLIQGLFGLAIGLIALFWPFVTAGAIILLIAAWALITGLIEVAAALRLRREIENEWMLILSGALSMLLGLMFAFFPAAGIWVVTWFIGVYAVVGGVALIQLGLRLRRMRGAA